VLHAPQVACARGVCAAANSPCQIDAPVVYYLLSTSVAASVASLQPPFRSQECPEIAQFLRNLSPLESALIQVFILNNLKSFRMNTYEKHGDRGEWLTRNPMTIPALGECASRRISIPRSVATSDLSPRLPPLSLYFAASLPPTSSFLTNHGIITCRKITGSGHTFTCRPRCPPCGLIHASFGTSPVFRIK
jgi:hypothetical protein